MYTVVGCKEVYQVSDAEELAMLGVHLRLLQAIRQVQDEVCMHGAFRDEVVVFVQPDVLWGVML